ncbi:MAG: hypothetical protein ACFE0R_04865 [Salinarimonas sp.]
MTDEEIRRVVEPILRKHLGPFGFETAEVASGVDHDGDPAIFVSAKYATAEPERARGVRLDAGRALREALWEHGEERIAYVRHRFPETEPGG